MDTLKNFILNVLVRAFVIFWMALTIYTILYGGEIVRYTWNTGGFEDKLGSIGLFLLVTLIIYSLPIFATKTDED